MNTTSAPACSAACGATAQRSVGSVGGGAAEHGMAARGLQGGCCACSPGLPPRAPGPGVRRQRRQRATAPPAATPPAARRCGPQSQCRALHPCWQAEGAGLGRPHSTGRGAASCGPRRVRCSCPRCAPGVASCADACDRLVPRHHLLVGHMAARFGPLVGAGRRERGRWAGGRMQNVRRHKPATGQPQPPAHQRRGSGKTEGSPKHSRATTAQQMGVRAHTCLLVFDQYPREPGRRVAPHRALHIDGVAVPCVAVADDCGKGEASYGGGGACKQAVAAAGGRARLGRLQSGGRRHALGRRRVASWQLRPVSTISAYDIRPVAEEGEGGVGEGGLRGRAASEQRRLLQSCRPPDRAGLPHRCRARPGARRRCRSQT